MSIKSLLNKQVFTGLIAGIIIMGVAGSAVYFANAQKEKYSWLPVEDIEARSAEFINKELVQGGTATAKVVGKEGDLYKLEISYNGQKIPSFISKDGKRFFPQVMDLSGNTPDTTKTNTGSTVDQVSEKSDKPTVELFVMSHCPYGTQIEKGILPVAKVLGDKIDFKIKFTDYAMHGEKELKEQLNQYCIQKEQTAKYSAYLECFLKDGDSGAENCLNQSGVDKTKLSGCVAKTDKEYKVLENFNNKVGFKGSYPGFEIFKSDNQKYSVAGSPTLVINGAQSQSGRDSKSLLKSICSAFNNPPKECSTELSSETPAPGFGGGTAPSGSSGNGGCH